MQNTYYRVSTQNIAAQILINKQLLKSNPKNNKKHCNKPTIRKQ